MHADELRRYSKLIKGAIKHTRTIKEIATTFYKAGLINKKEYGSYMSQQE